jgi:uncharacterized membrane protein YdjX (TVP38/TMEM64 family)
MRRHIRLLAVCLMLGLILGLLELTGLRAHFTLDALQTQLSTHRLQGFAFFTVLFCLGNLAQIPGWIFLAAAVLALDRIAGGIATYLAASASCLVVFLIVRTIGGDALRKMDNTVAKRILASLDQRPFLSVWLLRMLFQTAPPLNYSLALSGIGVRPYLFGTLLGLPLPIAVYCLLFDYLAGALQIR